MTLERHALALALAHLISTGAITTTNTPGELAQEAELAMAQEGYQITSFPPVAVRVTPSSAYPCTCATKPWCISHPFGLIQTDAT